MIWANECTVGRLVNTYAKGLKLAIVVGYTRTGKIQVCKWSDNSRSWSRPQNVGEDKLYPIDVSAISRRHNKIVADARNHVTERGGLVKYSGGAHNVGGEPFLGVARVFSRAKDGPPVTKLAPAIGVSTPAEGVKAVDPAKLRKLNAKLSTALFGRKGQP